MNKKLTVVLVAALTIIGILTSANSAGASPNVNCSVAGHDIIAVDNSQSGDGKLVRVGCTDGSSSSDASVVGGGTDISVICNSGNFTIESTPVAGSNTVDITCASGLKSYFNGDKTVNLSDTSNEAFNASDLQDTLDGAAKSTTIEADCEEDELNAENCDIVKYLVNGINLLSAVAGLAIVASIMIAGYQYMTARDNSGQIEAAKKRIIWAIVALVLFLFMYAILNFLVPGGVL